MAKVTGPLMSMDASGAFGGTLVFGKWKGRPTVRQLVTPSNPQTQGQQDARNRVRVLGNGQHFANLTAQVRAGETETDKVLLTAAAPGGQAWNGFLVKSAIGAAGANYTAGRAAYAALTGPQQAAWEVAAAALVPAIPDTIQKDALGVAGTPVSDGEGFFLYEYGMFKTGIVATPPGAVPTVFA